MRKFTYIEWIAVVIALLVAVMIFAPSFISFFSLGTVGNDTVVKDNLGVINNNVAGNENNKEQMTNISTVNGIEIYELQAGEGAEVKAGNKATVHYVGMFTDNTVFDTSLKTNTPFVFTVGRGEVIKGWDVGLLGMKVGSVRRFVISPELAYGPTGAGPIPPNSTLVFEVELLKVE